MKGCSSGANEREGEKESKREKKGEINRENRKRKVRKRTNFVIKRRIGRGRGNRRTIW